MAASRGKINVVFVKPELSNAGRSLGKSLGYSPVRRFTKLPDVRGPQYDKPFLVGDAFDVKYAENVEACYDLLDLRRLDNGQGSEIELERTDSLIDLSPVVGHWQEALHFEDYDTLRALRFSTKPMVGEFLARMGKDPWTGPLILTAVETEQRRYGDQVDFSVPDQGSQTGAWRSRGLRCDWKTAE